MSRTQTQRREAKTSESDGPDGRWAPWRDDGGGAGFPDKFWMLVTGLLVVILPALTLLVAYVALTATRSVAIGRLTPVEAVELYLIEVVAFALFSYLLYRLTLYSVRRQGAVEDGGATTGSTVDRRETESATHD
jgi:hypothetical protein